MSANIDELYWKAFWEASVDVVVTSRHQFCPVDRAPESQAMVVLRIEDAAGVGPYFGGDRSLAGFDGSEAGKHFVSNALDARWGVRRFADLHLHQAAGKVKSRAVFGLAAYLARDVVSRDREVVFSVASSKRLGSASGEIGGAQVLIADDFRKVGGALGATDGGIYQDIKSGKTVYLKLHRYPEHAQHEALAGALYRASGLSVFLVQLAAREGRLGTASEWQRGLSPIVQGKPCPDAWAGFAVDAWLANWDVAGGAFRNLMRAADGSIMRTDAGGSLGFRALGAPKVYGPEVRELSTMLNPRINPSAARIFAGIDRRTINAGIERVVSISPERIRELTAAYGLADLADTLVSRRAHLVRCRHE